MLQDSGAKDLITQQRFVKVFDQSVKIISLDTDWKGSVRKVIMT